MESPDTPSRRRGPARLVAAGALSTVLVLSACGSSSSTTQTADTPGETTESTMAIAKSDTVSGLVRPDPLQVGDVTLPDVTPGNEGTFAFKAQPGRALFVFFGYTHCPDVCPTTLFDLKKALGAIGPEADKVDIAFVTVDPERDTGEEMSTFLNHFVDGAHAIRTEDALALQQAQDQFLVTSSVVKTPDGEIEVSHSGTSFLVDANGQVMVEWTFGTKPEVLANDLQLLLAQLPPAGTNSADAATTS
jgi:protein SCO1/2